jgi:hypothetical protein
LPAHLVTCPEYAHLELLSYEVHPLGTLVVRCTRLDQAAASCSRTCAQRFDGKARLRRRSSSADVTPGEASVEEATQQRIIDERARDGRDEP